MKDVTVGVVKFLKPIAYWVLGAALLSAGIAAWQRHLASELYSRIYRVGFGDDPPFQFRDEAGRPSGVAIEIVKEAALRRGIHLEWVQPAHFAVSAIEHGETDLWVLMTDLPERHGKIYITEPYLTMERCFLVLKSSGASSARDLQHARIGYRQSWAGAPAPQRANGASSNADQLYLRAHFPEAAAVPLPMERAGNLIQALKDHTVEAGLVNKTVIAAQLVSEGGREALDLINAPDAIGALGLGASFDARRAAASIRDEIDRMAEDGGMSRITEPWGFFQSASLNIIGQLADVKRTNRMLAGGVAGLSAAIVLVTLLTMLVRRERNAVRELGSQLISAQEHERTRIARDLHDDINQQLAMLAMALGRLKQSSAAYEDAGSEQWQRLLGQVEQVRSGVYRISHALHPALLELAGLVPALEALRRDVAAASGMGVTLDPGPLAEPGGKAVPAEVALCLYRVAQEALQNAVKHSTSKDAHIRIVQNGKTLELSVTDSGKGIPGASLRAGAGLGLVSMQERARLMHGRLRIDTHTEGPRKGTTVTIALPSEVVSWDSGGTRMVESPKARSAVSSASPAVEDPTLRGVSRRVGKVN